MEYIDYNITIGNGLGIIASSEGVSKADVLRFDKNEIESAIEKLAIEGNSIDRNFIKTIGTKLSDALFTPEIKQHLYSAKKKAANKGLRIRLKIESPEVSTYPWEALYENNKFMAASVETSLTRIIPANIPAPAKRNFEKPLKILVIGSNPSSFKVPAVKMEREIDVIKDALNEETGKGNIKLDIERIGDISKIMDRLNNEHYNIIHFIGHGAFEDGTGYLVLEDIEGNLLLVDHERIGQIFQNQTSLGLVVLNACQGASISDALSTSKAFTGLAPELIGMGIPSVIAMRYSITNETAMLFSKEFYKNLPRMPIDENIQRVRQRILVDPGMSARDFIQPVLFTNVTTDGMVFSHGNATSIELAQNSALNEKIEELRKVWDDLISGSEDVGIKDFWLLIWGIYKNNRSELNKKALKGIENMIIIVPGLIKDHEQALFAGRNEDARRIEQTIKNNFIKFMEIL